MAHRTDGLDDVDVSKNGTPTSSRPIINFIEGTNVTLTVTDNAGNDRVDVTIAATGGGNTGDSARWHATNTRSLSTSAPGSAGRRIAVGASRALAGSGVMSVGFAEGAYTSVSGQACIVQSDTAAGRENNGAWCDDNGNNEGAGSNSSLALAWTSGTISTSGVTGANNFDLSGISWGED